MGKDRFKTVKKMKTKLLRKVRKRFEIYYHPNGLKQKYCLIDKCHIGYEEGFGDRWLFSKEECIGFLLKKVRSEYKKYSINYKRRKIKIKVWHV